MTEIDVEHGDGWADFYLDGKAMIGVRRSGDKVTVKVVDGDEFEI